jgi:hypothetical protein
MEGEASKQKNYPLVDLSENQKLAIYSHGPALSIFLRPQSYRKAVRSAVAIF